MKKLILVLTIAIFSVSTINAVTIDKNVKVVVEDENCYMNAIDGAKIIDAFFGLDAAIAYFDAAIAACDQQ